MAPPGVCGNPAQSTAVSPRQSPSRLQLDVIPAGTVQRICDEAEARIVAQGRETDTVLLRRAQRHAGALREFGQTYRQRLHAIAAVGLFNMGPALTQFFHDHENMWRAITRTHQVAQRAACSSTVDVLTHVNIRIIDIRNRLYRQWIMSTCSPYARHAMQTIVEYGTEISNLRVSLTNEFVRILTAWGQPSSIDLEDHELENVGPDHDVNDLGQDVEACELPSRIEVGIVSEPSVDRLLNDPSTENTTMQDTKGNPNHSPTPSLSPNAALCEDAFLDDDDSEEDYDDDDDDRCCNICTELYTDGHRAFSLTGCGHTFGKPCISRWVNSTAHNANRCPQCRATLCARRPRRPIAGSQAASQVDNQDRLQTRLDRVTHLFGVLADIHAGLRGLQTRNDFFDECMAGLNGRFFIDGMSWIVVPDDTSEDGWRLRSHDWHA